MFLILSFSKRAFRTFSSFRKWLKFNDFNILEIGGKSTDPKEILKQFGTDLTEMAKNSKLDPVIGREEEIRRTLQM